METLSQIYNRIKAKGYFLDKNTDHSYIEVYEEILSPYRADANCNILEIGLFDGGSLLMWEEYFKGVVTGVDCEVMPHGGLADLRPLMTPQHNILIMDAASKHSVDMSFKNVKFDVIIEDASHDLEQQLQIYNNFKYYLAPGGIYIIEDVQDIGKDKNVFEKMDLARSIEILDRRHIKNRYDDILVIIK